MLKYSDHAWNPVFRCQGGFARCNKCYARGQMLKWGFCDDFNSVEVNRKQLEADTPKETYDIAKKITEEGHVHWRIANLIDDFEVKVNGHLNENGKEVY